MNTEKIVDKIIEIENERRDLDLYKQRVEEIFGLIADEEFKLFLENNVEFIVDLMDQYGYLDELVLKLFVFINKNTCFKNTIDRESCVFLASQIEDSGHVTHERIIFYVDEYLENANINFAFKINSDSEVAFFINRNKKIYYKELLETK